MSDRTISLDDNLYDYVKRTWLREPELMKRLREETAAIGPESGMQISPEQGQLMGTLLELIDARKIFEVGTFTGYSAIAMAMSIPDDGRIITCEISEEWAAIARRYAEEAGVAQRIDIRLAPAIETINALLEAGEAETFDAAFLDADKSNYDQYYEGSLRLLRSGGLIMIDNVLWSGRVADPSVTDDSTVAIRALNEKLTHDERVTLSLAIIGDGLTIARKRP